MSFSSGNPVAVLVDAESVAAADARSAIEALAIKFPPLILHAFGDFRRPELQGWCDILEEFDGQALQVTPTDGHINSVHVCLTMNAMEIIHADRASAMCIFCGDGDFSQLAVRIRKAELPVLGFGTSQGGVVMSPWFDSWYVIGDEDDPETAYFDLSEELPEDNEDTACEPVPDEQHRSEFEPVAWHPDVDPMLNDSSVFVEQAAATSAEDAVTDADIEAAVHSVRTRSCGAGVVEPDERGEEQSAAEEFDDVDVMAAIEGKTLYAPTVIENPPPLADEHDGGVLTDDVTLLLSGFITDNLNGNGYALLSDVAHAATVTDLLVPPEEKSAPDAYLRQLVAEDARFEITTIPTGNGEPEFIRRV